MRTAAIIPARGGSKRLPRKNLARVGGLTLTEHAIASAASCDEVWVSTDDDEIAAVAARAGARVLMRPAHLASDTASTESAVTHWWRSLRSGERPDAIAIVQAATLVVRDAADHLRNALRDMERVGAPCIAQVCVTATHHFAGRLYPREDGVPEWRPFMPPDGERPRTQDLRKLGDERGAFWCMTREHWETTGKRGGRGCRAYPMSTHNVVDIDDAEDLEDARAKWDAAHGGGGGV
jgi:CMP-N-acetylneuraminic acid synthetase